MRKDAEVIALVSLAHATSHFFHLILAPLFLWLKVEFNLSYAELGFLMTIFFVVSTVVQALAGFWVDHSGPLRVLLFGMAMLSLAAFILGAAMSYNGLLLGAFIAGLGNGVFHPSDYTLINRQVSMERVPYAYSMHGVSGALGWAIAPIFLVAIASLAGWRYAFLAAGLMSFSVMILIALRRSVLLHVSADRSKSLSQKNTNNSLSLSFLKLPAVWMCWLFFFLSALALSGVQSFVPSALQKMYDMPLAITTGAYSAYMFASAFGMFMGGFVVTRFKKPERIMAWAFVIASLIAVLIASKLINSDLVLMLFTVMGFGVGLAGPSRDLIIRAATPPEASGRVFGIVYSGLDSGLAIGPLIFGHLMDWNLVAFVFYGIALFLLLALFTVMKVNVSAKQIHMQAT